MRRHSHQGLHVDLCGSGAPATLRCPHAGRGQWACLHHQQPDACPARDRNARPARPFLVNGAAATTWRALFRYCHRVVCPPAKSSSGARSWSPSTSAAAELCQFGHREHLAVALEDNHGKSLPSGSLQSFDAYIRRIHNKTTSHAFTNATPLLPRFASLLGVQR